EIVILDKKEHLIIERDASNWNPEVDGWKMILPNGVSVYFQDLEKVYQPVVETDCSSSAPSLTWKITRIELKSGEEIDFIYSNNIYETASITDYDIHAYEDDANYTINYTRNGYGNFDVPVIPNYCTTIGRPVTMKYELKTLNQINSPKYTVDFNLVASKDKPMLESVEIIGKLDPTFKLGYNFSLVPFNCADGAWNQWTNGSGVTQTTATEANFIKYKLTRLQKYTTKSGVTADMGNAHKFEYHEDIGIPSMLSFAQDYWGYYNGQHNNTGLIPDESQIYATEGPYPVSSLPDRLPIDDLRERANSNRGASINHMIQGTLKKISYPTTGYTVFNFEPNEFYLSDVEDYILLADEINYNGLYYVNNYTGSSSAISTGAGLRIKEIVNYDTDGQFVSRKKFEYNESGILLEPVHFWRIDPQVQVIAADEIFYYKTWSGNSTSHSQSFAIPNSVGYSHVVVTESDSETDHANEKTNGKTSYHFHNYETVYNLQLSRVSVGFLDSRNGLPSSVESFDEVGSSIKKTTYDYTKVESSLFLSMAAKHTHKSSTEAYNIFKIEYTPIKSEWWKENWIEEAENNVLRKTDFVYSSDSHSNARLLSQTTKTSVDEPIEIKYYYAQDDPSDILTSPGTLSELIDLNMVEVPLKTEKLVSGILTEGSIVNYGSDLFPSSTYNYIGSSYQFRQEFDYERGKLLNYQDNDGVPISYIWGYNNSYPIAKVLNAENANGISEHVRTENKTLEYDNHTSESIDINSDQDITISYYFYKTDPSGNDTPSLLFSIGEYESETIVIPSEKEGLEGSVIISSVPAGTYNFTVHQDADTEVAGEVYYYENVETQIFKRITEIHHQNFEEYVSAVQSSESHTGNYMYTGVYEVELRDKIEGKYLLSYWLDNGSGWTFKEYPITVTSESTIHTIDGTGIKIDDIRLHPVDAMMTTYTYDPLIGMTSQTDQSGITAHYVYDDFGRLEYLKDEEGNVIKKYQYHYADQY
ncbi:MAG: hypothetical protein KAI99_08750, partial [Cyclobacteriaceae bacterium]|nr:hypothetical protein [Cyclobacteriaceae bacterium]